MNQVLNIGMRNNHDSNTVTVEATIARDGEAFREALGNEIIKQFAKKYLDEHAEEILAAIDLEAIKKKTSDKVAVEALRSLAKGSEL